MDEIISKVEAYFHSTYLLKLSLEDKDFIRTTLEELERIVKERGVPQHGKL